MQVHLQAGLQEQVQDSDAVVQVLGSVSGAPEQDSVSVVQVPDFVSEVQAQVVAVLYFAAVAGFEFPADSVAVHLRLVEVVSRVCLHHTHKD